MEKIYGSPEELEYTQPVNSKEYDRIASSMKQGRAHDITLYIKKDGGYIFIAKHIYPPGLFRAPSGGVKPGENFEDGAKREAFEETGTDIRLLRYILRIKVRFEIESRRIDWSSHIFSAEYIEGEIEPHDRDEIKETRLIYPDEIPGFIEIMKNVDIGGLNYRAFLTEEMRKRLDL